MFQFLVERAAIDCRRRGTRQHFDKLAVTVDHRVLGHRDESAAGARNHLRRSQKRTLRTFLRKLLGRPRLRFRALAAVVEGIMTDIGDESEPGMIIAVPSGASSPGPQSDDSCEGTTSYRVVLS